MPLGSAETQPANRLGGVVEASLWIGWQNIDISVKALYELQRTGGRYGRSPMCIGGGHADDTTAIEAGRIILLPRLLALNH
jgi:acetyl-CoA acetyltransferase